MNKADQRGSQQTGAIRKWLRGGKKGGRVREANKGCKTTKSGKPSREAHWPVTKKKKKKKKGKKGKKGKEKRKS